MAEKEKPEVEGRRGADWSPARALARAFGAFSKAAKRYRMEWWILVIGLLIIAVIHVGPQREVVLSLGLSLMRRAAACLHV